jgi:hypothetical protein
MGQCRRGIPWVGHAFSAWVAAGCKAPPLGMLDGFTGPAARTAAAIVGKYTEEVHGAPSLMGSLDRWCGGTCDPHVHLHPLAFCTLLRLAIPGCICPWVSVGVSTHQAPQIRSTAPSLVVTGHWRLSRPATSPSVAGPAGSVVGPAGSVVVSTEAAQLRDLEPLPAKSFSEAGLTATLADYCSNARLSPTPESPMGRGGAPTFVPRALSSQVGKSIHAGKPLP